MLVDSHCHLDFPELATDADGVVARARAAGIGTMVTIGTELARFPGVRRIEIATRIDWVGFLPYPRAEHMQRNKVVFDSPAALTAALASPVRAEMRADFHRFPPFTGVATHYPMLTTSCNARSRSPRTAPSAS